MNRKQPVKFAFTNGLKIRKLNVNTDELENTGSFDICNEIDDLLSDVNMICQNNDSRETEINTANNIKYENNKKAINDHNFNVKQNLKETANFFADEYKSKPLQIEYNNVENDEKSESLIYVEDGQITDFMPDKKMDESIFKQQTDKYEPKIPKMSTFVVPDFTKFKLDCNNTEVYCEPENKIKKLISLLECIDSERDLLINKIKEKDAIIAVEKENIDKLQKSFKEKDLTKIKLIDESIKKCILKNQISHNKMMIENIGTQLNSVANIVQGFDIEMKSEISRNKDLIQKTLLEKQVQLEKNILNNKSMQKEIDTLNAKLISANEENKKLISDKNISITQLKTYNEKIIMYENQIGTFNENSNKCETQMKLHLEKIEKLNNIILQNENKHKQDKSEFNAIIDINKSLKLDIINLKQRLEDLKEVENKLNVMEIEERKYKDKNIEIEDERNYLQEKVNNLEFKCDNYEDYIHNRSLKIKSFKLSIKNTLILQQSKLDCINTLLDDIEKLETNDKLDEYYNTIYKNELKKYIKEKNNYKAEINTLQVENKKLRNQSHKKKLTIEPYDSDIWNVF